MLACSSCKRFGWVFALVVYGCFGAKSSEDQAIERLQGGGLQSQKALEQVISHSDQRSAGVLFVASQVAMSENRLADAGTLLMQAQLRGKFDLAIFPPTGTGPNHPMTALGSLNESIGSTVNPAIARNPHIYTQVIARLESWMPSVPNNYDPGWDYSRRGDEAVARNGHQEHLNDYMAEMKKVAQLLCNPEYLKCFKIVQDYNLGADVRLTKIDYDAAIGRMKELEANQKTASIPPQTLTK